MTRMIHICGIYTIIPEDIYCYFTLDGNEIATFLIAKNQA